MRVLLHVCCGPCAIMPLRRLLDEGHQVEGFFYNPNIQPLAEYLRRREGAAQVAEQYRLRMHWAVEGGDYDTAGWLRRQAAAGADFSPATRCPQCWRERLDRAFALAARHGFAAVTTSLLYSRRQRHEEIAALGLDLAGEYGVEFLYRDWRPDWQQGIELSKEWGVYRQPYCGCIFSENDRYARDLQKANAALKEDNGES